MQPSSTNEQQQTVAQRCLNCGGQNITYQAVGEIVQEDDKIKRTIVETFLSAAWIIGAALDIGGRKLYPYSGFFYAWAILLFIPKNTKTVVRVHAVCQDCGNRISKEPKDGEALV